ncbi:MAG: hypothetical protein J6Q15_02910 [Clostridia bacterium]|nr:hypothetical protein [Clostridia bacterium]
MKDKLNQKLELCGHELNLKENFSGDKFIDNEYTGNFIINEKEIKVLITVDERLVDYKITCEKFLNNFEENYKNVLMTIAKELCFEINQWHQNRDHEITQEEIVKRLSKSNLEIDCAFGEFWVVILDDDGLAFGEQFIYQENLDTHEVIIELG